MKIHDGLFGGEFEKQNNTSFFATTLMFSLSGISAEVKTKPKLEVGKKIATVGQKCQSKLNGVPCRARVK